MPETIVFRTTYYHNTPLEWLGALFIILAGVVCAKLLYWVFGNVLKKLSSKTKTKLDDIIIDMSEEPASFALVLAAIWIALKQLTFPSGAESFISGAFQFVVTLNVAWLVTRLLDALYKQYIIPIAEKSKTDLDDQVLPIIRKGTKIVIWVLAVIIALNNAGYDVGAALAGLGIGGLALAMASRDMVANVFGGMTIFLDKPFTINDRIKVDGIDGICHEIGLRTTRLRTLDGTLVTIPNSTFSDEPVENISAEPSRKITCTIGLTYDMTAEQVEEAITTLREIAESHEDTEEKVLVAFTEFGDFSMNVLFIYYITKGADILKTRTEINLATLQAFNEKGLEMAFPTQTVYTIPPN